MKTVFIASIILLQCVIANAGDKDCPQVLVGNWLCHDVGMPLNSSDETTFDLQFKKMDFEKLNHRWHLLPDGGPHPWSGLIKDVETKSHCENQTLVIDRREHVYPTATDWSNKTKADVYETRDVYTSQSQSYVIITHSDEPANECFRK